MALKTLSVDEEAYKTLLRARKHRRESFSQVIKRAKWDNSPKLCGAILEQVVGKVSESTLERLSAAQNADAPPIDKWSR